MKKVKKEEKNVVSEILKYVLPILIAVLVFCVIKFGILGRDYELESINVDKYISLVSGSKESLIYITENDCATCNDLEELFQKVLKGSKVNLYKINVSELSNADMERFMEVLDITKENIETPLVIYTKEKEILSTYRPPFSEDSFITFLKENNLVK